MKTRKPPLAPKPPAASTRMPKAPSISAPKPVGPGLTPPKLPSVKVPAVGRRRPPPVMGRSKFPRY